MNVQQELKKAIENFKSLELAKSHLAKLNKRLQDAHLELEELRTILDKEYEDVKALEEMTIHNLFRKVLGDQEKQLEKERQEYLHAALKYNEFLETVELMEFEQTLLEKKVAGFKKAKSLLHSLIRQREQQLTYTDQAVGKLIRNIDGQIDAKLKMKREIHEALTVGVKVTEILRQMNVLLEKATEWGRWDNSMDVQDKRYGMRVDQATKLSYEAKQLLLQFEDELKDIYRDQNIKMSYNLESFQHFNRFFFDNLISDWVLQRKVRNALYNVQAVKDKVIRICSSLRQELKQSSGAIEYLIDKKEKIILELHK